MAFELGLIDNLGTGLEAALSQRQYEPAKYVYMQQGCLITNSFPSMNLELWNSLSPELQDIFMNKVGPEVYEFAWDLIVKTDLNAKEELESLGLIFSEMTDEDRELARDCVWNSPTLATYLAMMDPDIVALADALRSEPYDEAPHYPDWSP